MLYCAARAIASTGPRSIERGVQQFTRLPDGDYIRFNGAALN